MHTSWLPFPISLSQTIVSSQVVYLTKKLQRTTCNRGVFNQGPCKQNGTRQGRVLPSKDKINKRMSSGILRANILLPTPIRLSSVVKL